MIIDDFYNYIVIGLFEQLYKYEDKKSISVDNLKYLRKVILEEVLDKYYNEDESTLCYYEEVDQWHGKVSFKEIDENKALQAFLDKYEDYFYLDNGIVHLKDNFTYDDISELERKVRIDENVPDRISSVATEVRENPKMMSALGISSIAKIKEEYSKVEKKLEKLYYKLYTADDNESLRKQIKSLLYMRFNFFYYISQMPEYKVDAFRLVHPDYGEKEEDTDYDKSPIDLKLWEQHADLEDFLEDIDDRIYNINQYAIFGKKQNHLWSKKFEEDLDSYYMSNCFFEKFGKEDDPLEDYTDMTETDMLAAEQFEERIENNPESLVTVGDPAEEFYLLYMNYLKNLNHFMTIYGESEELLFAKKRLLYVLDRPELLLFDEKRFATALDKTKTIELDEEPFNFFLYEIYFIAYEVFMVPTDEYTIKKLLLVGTYYDLTKDEYIKEIVTKFKDNPKYDSFYEIMINNCKNMTTDNLSQDIKQLVLKKNDKNKPKN